jgi:hypothetical protein
MSGISGPKIITSGCVLSLDAADKLSYKGSGTTWKDLSGNNNTGTLTNGPTFNAGNMGSIVFDGTNDYVDLANTTTFNFTNTTGTISLWFKTSASTTNGPIFISKQMDATGGWAISMASDAIPYFEAKNSGGGATAFYRYVNKVCNDGVWHNIVAVFTTSTTVVGNNTVSMYLDGVLANGAQTQLTVYGGNTAGTVQIARRSSGNYYNGNISSLQIYNIGLTATEVLQNYNATKSRFNR